MKRKSFLFLLIGLAVSLAGMQPAQATVLTYDLNYEYSGGANPAGSPPWLVATFSDEVSGLPSNTVRLTMDASGLTGRSEFVTKWLFNINIGDPSLGGFPSLTEQLLLDSLIFHDQTPSVADSVYAKSLINSYDLNPASGFDIEFSFPTSNGSWNRFTAGETVIYDIISPLPITAITFDASNITDPNGPYSRSVAKVQGINTFPGSGKFAENPNPNPVPEPATMLLLGMGLVGLAGFGRKRLKA
jgi:hypothetical protein